MWSYSYNKLNNMLNKRKDRDHTPTTSGGKSQGIRGTAHEDTFDIEGARTSSLRELIE
jgi:hypothetical protein